MKKILTGALTLMLFMGAAQAQTKDSTKRGHHRQEMVSKLNITADQQARLKTIHESQKQEFKALKEQGLKGEELQARRKEMHKKYAEQMQAVYTPAQKEEMKKMRAERKAQAKDGKKNFRKDGRGMKHGRKHGKKGDFSKSMDLSEAQKLDMQKIRQESKSAFEALKNDQSISEDEKKAKMKALRKAQHEKMKSVLTAEQIEKMKGHKKENRPKSK